MQEGGFEEDKTIVDRTKYVIVGENKNYKSTKQRQKKRSFVNKLVTNM